MNMDNASEKLPFVLGWLFALLLAGVIAIMSVLVFKAIEGG